MRAQPAKSLILYAEVIAPTVDRHPHVLQTTVRRFGREIDVHVMRASLPLNMYAFDCLQQDGANLIDRPLLDRFDEVVARPATPCPCNAPRFSYSGEIPTPKDRKDYRVVESRRAKSGRWVLVRRRNRRALCVAHVVTV